MNHETSTHSSVKTYLLVFVGLGILTGLTVSLSYMNFPHSVGITLAALISLAKCLLIATFFMHMKTERWTVRTFLLVGLCLVGVLLFALIPDIGMMHHS